LKLPRHRYLLPDEFKRLLYAARTRPHLNSLRDYTMLCVGGLCGLRAKEIIGIRVSDCLLSADPPTLRVCTAKRRRTSDKPVSDEVHLPPRAAKALKVYLRALSGNKWDRIFPITTRSAERLFKLYARKAGLDPRLSIHSLRHFCGLQAYRRTKDAASVQKALRHVSVSSTRIYVDTVSQE
jgi:integrase